MSEVKRKSFTPDEDSAEQIKSWYIEPVEDIRYNPTETNAVGKRLDWVYEPPEEVIDEPKPPTLEEIEEIRQAAHDEGFAEGKEAGFAKGHEEGFAAGKTEGHEQGFAEGKQQGLDEGRELLEEKAKIWDQKLHHLINPLLQVDHKTEKQLVELTTHLARAIVHVETQINPEVVRTALKQAMEVLPLNAELYIIRLNPEDLELLKEHFSTEEIEKRRWHFQTDPDLTRGGCEVITEASSVDMTIEKRVKDILDEFLLQAGINNE